MKHRPRPLLPLRAAARALGVRPTNLRAEADAGRVPFTKLGDDYLFSLSALEAALAARVECDPKKGADHAH